MNKIDIKGWKNFHLYDEHMFNIDMGNKFDKSKMDTTKNDINFIGRTGSNNGINATCGIYNNIEPYKPGLLTLALGGSVGSCFIQKKSFYTSQNVIVLIPKDNISDNVKQFIATVIQKESELHYKAFVKELNAHIKTDFVIPLPVNADNEPDWEYMESYMKNIMQESEKNIEKLNNIHNSKKTIDILGWREFSLGGDNGLFRIVKGTRLTKANMKDGNINFIGSSSVNNGITNHISNLEHIHPANLITVSYNGSIGEAFYQEKPFWASDDVNVFYPNFKQSFEIAMFLIPLIRKIGQKYKFVDKWKLEDMCNDKITLPINGNGEPAWDYMENYMKNIMNDTKAKLNILKTAI